MILMMQGSTSIAANATDSGILNSQKYNRPPFDAYGTLYATGSATGIFATLNVDGLAVTDEIAVNANNRIPIVPDDLALSGFETPGTGLIQLSARNSTAGALTFFWKVLLESAQ